jgi:hypothetical protein
LTVKHDKWIDKLKAYFKVRNELSVKSNIILRGSKLIIPNHTSRARFIDSTWNVKTKQLLREQVWWVGSDKDVENLIATAELVKWFEIRQPPPLQVIDLPKQKWERIGMDFTQEENICLLFPLPRSRSTEIYNCKFNHADTYVYLRNSWTIRRRYKRQMTIIRVWRIQKILEHNGIRQPTNSILAAK